MLASWKLLMRDRLMANGTNRNKDSIVPCRCGGDLAYTVIQDVEINECANVVNVLMCQ